MKNIKKTDLTWLVNCIWSYPSGMGQRLGAKQMAMLYGSIWVTLLFFDRSASRENRKDTT